MKPRTLLAAAAGRLAEAGVASPEYDARTLLAHVLGIRIGRLDLLAVVPAENARTFRALVDERARRVPLQHLTGVAGFRQLDLAVGPGVFVPRPETEVLVEWVLSRLAGIASPVVVDLCAGSAAIALAVADEAPAARVYAVEREAHAAAWARRNLDAHPAGSRVHLHHGDIDGALPELDGVVDVVVANPPYIPDGAEVEREVAEHDPPAALWGGLDGLDVVRVVIATAVRLLRPGGVLGVEHADRQGDAVPALIGATAMGRLSELADRPDLNGRPRFTTAVRTEAPA